MLIIAVAHGFGCDPFTTSTSIEGVLAAEQGLDPSNATQMRDYICQDKVIASEYIDEVLVIYDGDDGEGPVVQHHHTEFDGDEEDEEDDG